MAIKKKKARAVLLALDVGNTMTKLGLFSGKKLLTDFQLASNRESAPLMNLELFNEGRCFRIGPSPPMLSSVPSCPTLTRRSLAPSNGTFPSSPNS
jgi:pantothenate kinase type III